MSAGCWCSGSATRRPTSRSNPRGIADATFLAMRRGAYVIPKYLRGVPTDEAGPPIMSRLPLPMQRFFFMSSIKVAAGDMTKYGLPQPDHKLLEAHPTVSSDLLPQTRARRHRGEAEHRLAIRAGARCGSSTASRRRSTWSSTARATRSPSRSSTRRCLSATDNRIPLYRRVVSAEHPGLYFIGFIQPLGAIMPIAEAQSEWIADLLQGKGELPVPGGDATRDRARGPADGKALRGLEAAHDPGRLLPLPAHDRARAPQRRAAATARSGGCSPAARTSCGWARASGRGGARVRPPRLRRAAGAAARAGQPQRRHGSRQSSWRRGCARSWRSTCPDSENPLRIRGEQP